jgi:hypothetical protein
MDKFKPGRGLVVPNDLTFDGNDLTFDPIYHTQILQENLQVMLY